MPCREPVRIASMRFQALTKGDYGAKSREIGRVGNSVDIFSLEPHLKGEMRLCDACYSTRLIKQFE